MCATAKVTKFVFASDNHGELGDSDSLAARQRRDEMLEAFDSGQPIPHLNNK